MCSQFLIDYTYKKLQNEFSLSPTNINQPETYSERIVPHYNAPVIIADGSFRIIKSMSYSLVPSWSSVRKPKFVTYNARLDSIEKPTWKTPFLKKHAIVPISRFIEPIYTGEYAGNMVQFFEKENLILAAAGIYSEWLDKTNGETVESFAILTDDPPEYVSTKGHDRCPIFLKREAYSSWLNADNQKADSLQKFLRGSVNHINFDIAIDRPMAKGWEKRIPKE